MDVFPKFIIETDEELGDCLIIAKCTYHKQLVTFPEKVKGGGWWKKTDEETFCLYGSSEDFGTAKLEDIKACVLSGNVFTNSGLMHSIASKFKFKYDTGSETLNLKSE